MSARRQTQDGILNVVRGFCDFAGGSHGGFLIPALKGSIVRDL